jgi:hypothetical protein
MALATVAGKNWLGFTTLPIKKNAMKERRNGQKKIKKNMPLLVLLGPKKTGLSLTTPILQEGPWR